jgi:GT2 family glycosyltransferase
MVYVIVLNWNGAADTIACAESVLAMQGIEFRLLVCDNASTDDCVQRLRAWGASRMLLEYPNEPAAWGDERPPAGAVVLLHTGANLGYAGGNNVGMRYALSRGDAEFVWILNNDTTVAPSALAALVTKARSDPAFGIVGSTMLYQHAPERVQMLAGCRFSPWTTRIAPAGWGLSAHQAGAVSEAEIESGIDYICGASMLASADFIADVGLMHEDYFLYFEEMDWAERARRSPKRRWKFGYARDSVVFHKVGASTGTSQRTAASTRFFYTSKIRFMKRFYGGRFALTWLVVLAQALKHLLGGDAANALVILRVLLGSRRIAPERAP